MAQTAILFCAQCAVDKPFTLVVDGNSEIVATDDLGHVLKFPTPEDAEELRTWIVAHREANVVSAQRASADKAAREKAEQALGQMIEAGLLVPVEEADDNK